MSKNVTVSLTLPNTPEYVSVARLCLSGIANRVGFNIDDIEDLKVAVSEACTNALKHSQLDEDGKYIVNYTVEDKSLIIEVCDQGKGIDLDKIEEPDLENPKESGLGLYIIKTLMDDVEICRGENCGTTIRMIKNLEE